MKKKRNRIKFNIKKLNKKQNRSINQDYKSNKLVNLKNQTKTRNNITNKYRIKIKILNIITSYMLNNLNNLNNQNIQVNKNKIYTIDCLYLFVELFINDYFQKILSSSNQ